MTGVSNSNFSMLPGSFRLSQNYPNPFNPVTRIKYSVPVQSSVKLILYDVLGKEVKTIVNEVKPSGEYIYDLNASSLSSGVYFYKLEADGFIDTKRMILLK